MSGETSKISLDGGDSPVWSLDGQFIAFASRVIDRTPAFNIVNINDGFRFELAYYDGELSAGYSSDEQY
jgi:hypothetical protein